MDRGCTLQVHEFLGLTARQLRGTGPANIAMSGIGRFLLPVAECEFTLSTALDELQPNPYFVKSGHRPQRATGAALSVAASLMEGCVPNVGSRIMLFVGGPATVGPGMIVDTDQAKSIRTHQDLDNDRAPHYKKACKFYSQLAQRLVSYSHVLDIFACSLDQVIALCLVRPWSSCCLDFQQKFNGAVKGLCFCVNCIVPRQFFLSQSFTSCR